LLVLVLVAGLGGAAGLPPGQGGVGLSLDGLREGLREGLRFGGAGGSGPAGREPTARVALPRVEVAPVGQVVPEPVRVGELPGLATETATFFELSDGRVEAEVSAAPVRYRDGEGVLRPVDTTVVGSDRPGVVFENRTNTFVSSFGVGSDPRLSGSR
jgi:hypothetical protein